MELHNGVSWASLLVTRNHPWVAQESQIQTLPPTLQNAASMDRRQAYHGWFEVSPILDPLDVNTAYRHFASGDYCFEWHDQSYGCCYVNLGYEVDSSNERLLLRREVCTTEAAVITMLRLLQWPVCFSVPNLSLILSLSCDHLGSVTREWTFILMTRLLILPNTKRPSWSIRRMNTVRNKDDCL